MVGSLVKLSLRSISNGIKNGTIEHLHLLPPNLRQRVLTWLLDHDMVNDPKCLSLVTSVEFLNGMTSISIEGDSCCHLKFIRSLERSISTILSDGETVGAFITKLKLQLFCCSCSYSGDAFSLPPVISRLIGQCPNMSSLALCSPLTNNCPRDSWPWIPTLLIQDDTAYNRVMENLVELSIFGSKRVLGGNRPIINFRQLTTLKLENCSIAAMNQWPECLRNIPTLENLHVINVVSIFGWWETEGLDSILPFSMPQLKSLTILGFSVSNNMEFNKCNEAFVDHLMGCPNLRQVYLMLDKNSTDEESLVRLASMDIDLRVKIRFNIFKDDTAAIFNSNSHIKLVRIFHQRMDAFYLNMSGGHDPLFSTVLQDVVDKCYNLSTFHIHLYNGPASSNVDSEEQNRRIKASLIQFFGNSGRAMQLKSLSLIGNLDEAVISTIFENCLNLVRLSLRHCPQVRDDHLIDWVARGGGKLTRLSITYCYYVSSEGIISVLAKSGEGLLHYDTSTRDRLFDLISDGQP